MKKLSYTAASLAFLFSVAGCADTPSPEQVDDFDMSIIHELNSDGVLMTAVNEDSDLGKIYFEAVGHPLSLQSVLEDQSNTARLAADHTFEWVVAPEPQVTPGRAAQHYTKSVQVGHGDNSFQGPHGVYVGCEQPIIAGSPELEEIAAQVRQVCALDLN